MLSQDNRQRYLDNQPVFDAYRGDIEQIRSGVSHHAVQWPRAVAAIGWSAQRGSEMIETAALERATALAAVRTAIMLPPRVGAAAADEVLEATRVIGTAALAVSRAPGLLMGAAADKLEERARELLQPGSGIRLPSGLRKPNDRLDDETIQDSVRRYLPETGARTQPPAGVPLTFLDREHPDRPLFRLLRGQLPAEVNDEKVAEATLAAKRGGIDASAIQDVRVQDGRIFMSGQIPGDRAQVELGAPPPQLADTMRQTEQFDRQQVQQLAQFQEQQRQIDDPNRGGPTRTL